MQIELRAFNKFFGYKSNKKLLVSMISEAEKKILKLTETIHKNIKTPNI